MSVADAIAELDLESIGAWTMVDEDPEEQIRWHCGTGELVARPPSENAPAELELFAPIGGKLERETVWVASDEWAKLLSFAVSWLQKHDYGTPLEDPVITQDVGEWKHDSRVYIRDGTGTVSPYWRWRWERDEVDDVVAVVRPDEGTYAFIITDHEMDEIQHILDGHSPRNMGRQAVDWLDDREMGVELTTEVVPFSRRDIANQWRDKVPDEVLTGKYDRRHTEIELYPDLVDSTTLEQMHEAAMDSRSDNAEAYGQTALKDSEVKLIRKRKRNYAHTDRFKARSVKAIARTKGIDDWISHFDPQLTVDEHRDVLDDVAPGDLRDRKHKEVPTDVPAVKPRRRKFARQKCLEGEISACEHLLEYHDLSEEDLIQWAEEYDALANVLDDILNSELDN